MSVIVIILIASLKLASFQDWFWFGSVKVSVHLWTIVMAKDMESTDWQRLGIGSTPRGEESGSPVESPRVLFPADGGMVFGLTKQGVSSGSNLKGPGVGDKELNLMQQLNSCCNRRFFEEQFLLSSYYVLHVHCTKSK